MVTYDPAVLQQFADRLYNKARILATGVMIFAGAIGGVIGAALQASAKNNSGILPGLGVLFAGAIGFAIGRSMGFAYKLQAQQALCQMAIEQNTRTSRAAVA